MGPAGSGRTQPPPGVGRPPGGPRGGHHPPPRHSGGRYYYNVPGYTSPFWYGFWGFGLGLALGSAYRPYYSPFVDYGFPYVYSPSIVVTQVPTYSYTEVPRYSYGGGYYLSPGYQTGLTEAIADIRKGWTDGREDLLLKHVPADRQVQVYINGEYSYSLPSSDYTSMVRDAMGRVRTVAFTITGVERRSDGAYLVRARHDFRDINDQYKERNVSYTLAPEEGSWVIAAVGSSE